MPADSVPDPFTRMTPLRYAVQRCDRCGGTHDEPLTFLPLDRPNQAWTHYAMCPTNGQPIMLRTQGGAHSDDPILLHSLAAVSALATEVGGVAGMSGGASVPGPVVMSPPSRSVIDAISDAVGWDGSGLLVDRVLSVVSRHRPEVINRIVMALQGESLRLSGLGISHNLDSLALALINYRDGV